MRTDGCRSPRTPADRAGLPWPFLIATIALLLIGIRDAAADWRTFTTADGLASNYVYSILEDHTGAYWFAAAGWNGVSRYDGVTWTTYTAADGLAHDFVYSMLEDRHGVLWFGTNAGVSRYDGTTWTNYGTAEGLPGIYVAAMREDHTGALWFGTESGATRYDGATWKTYTTADGLGNSYVTAIAEDRTGAMWFGTWTGVSRYDGTNWTTYTSANGLGRGHVHAIVQDRTGAMWFATESGASRFDGTTWKTYTTADGLGGDDVSAIVEDRAGVLWFGGGGVSCYDGRRWTRYTKTDGLADNSVTSILADRAGRMWFGTWDRGVTLYDGVSWDTYTTAEGLGGNTVRAIEPDTTGALWFGGSGVSRFDGASWTRYTTADGLASNYADAIEVDRAGVVWLGGSGVTRFDGASCTRYTTSDGLVDNQVYAVRQDRTGAMWFGTRHGVSRYDGTNWTSYSTINGIPEVYVHVILEDRNGALWFGTENYLARYDAGNWTVYTTDDGLAFQSVYALCEDRTGALWIGTPLGLSRYDGVSWRTYTTADGLADDWVNAIAEDREGELWFGTRDGVSRYDGVNWTTYTLDNGLVDNEVTAIQEDVTGALWFGTNGGGVSRHRPDRIPALTRLSPKPPALSAGRTVTVGLVAALGETRVRFSHALDGQEWSPWSPTNSVTLTALPDGVHLFRARSRDQNGVVEEEPASATFEIDGTPPQPVIASPGFGEAVRESLLVRGTADDPRFLSYRLEARPAGSASWPAVPLAESSSPVAGGILGAWDTRAVPDGEYEIRLTTTDTLGLAGSVVVGVTVDNQPPFADQTAPCRIGSADGGHVYTTDAGVHLYFPPRAFGGDVVVRIDPLGTADVPDTLAGGVRRVAPGHDISFGGAALDKVATLDVALPESVGVNGEDLALYMSVSADGWRALGGTIDVEHRRISCPITGPGRYALFSGAGGRNFSSAPPPLTLTPRVFSPSGGFGSRSVAISFGLSRAARVTVRIYNRAGRLVREVATDEPMSAGANLVRWDGRGGDGETVPDGIYLVAMEVPDRKETKVLSVVR